MYVVQFILRHIHSFIFSDNPLNCDCLMAGFARWLREAKNLPQTDSAAAVCATPPHLEGALISRLSKNKLCDEIELKDVKDYEVKDIKVNIIDNSDASDSGDVTDVYDDHQDGLDDDVYDEELELPSEDDLPVSKAKVRIMF